MGGGSLRRPPLHFWGFLPFEVDLSGRSRLGRGWGGVFRSWRNISSRSCSCSSALRWSRWSAMERYENPFSIPDEHMRMVGIIACQWEHLEKTLEHAVAEIMEHRPHRVGVLTMHIGFHSKCEIIFAYSRVLEKEAPQSWTLFKRIMENLYECQKTRSEFIHASWHKNEDDPDRPLRLITTTRGKRFKSEEKPTDITELYEAAQAIEKHATSFILFMREFGLLQPSPETPSEPPPAHSNNQNQGT